MLVCRPTPFVRFSQTRELVLTTTDILDGTTRAHSLVFTHSPVLWNPVKRDLVENVQENYLPLLTQACENGNEGWTARQRGFHPHGLEAMCLSPPVGKSGG